MKIFVDEMPNKPNECPWHEWHSLPPCYKETGYYKCQLTKNTCHLKETECDHFKILKIKKEMFDFE